MDVTPTCGHDGARPRAHYCAGEYAICDAWVAERGARWSDPRFERVEGDTPDCWERRPDAQRWGPKSGWRRISP